MIHGIIIDETDTLKEYGLMLCADISVGMPEARTNYVVVPEADGELDLTGALTGGAVRYGMRTITLELFPVYDVIGNTRKPAPEEHVTIIRQALAAHVHGKTCKVWLPDDSNHYFRGRVIIGERGNYNSGKIPVQIVADPWRYRTEETEIRAVGDGEIVLANETMPTMPAFTATDATATVRFGSISYQLRPGKNRFDGIILNPGKNTVTLSGVQDPVIITYQEGSF